MKVTRPVPPWSKDYHTSVAELETNDLLKSTFTDETRTQKGDTKICLFCGFNYCWRVIHCREYLGLMETCQTGRQETGLFRREFHVLKQKRFVHRQTFVDRRSQDPSKISPYSISGMSLLETDDFCVPILQDLLSEKHRSPSTVTVFV